MKGKIATSIFALCLALPLDGTAASGDGDEVVCTDRPKETWVSAEVVSDMLARLLDKEFVLGVDKGCYEAEVIVDADTAIDVYVDPVTMEIVKIRTEGDSD